MIDPLLIQHKVECLKLRFIEYEGKAYIASFKYPRRGVSIKKKLFYEYSGHRLGIVHNSNVYNPYSVLKVSLAHLIDLVLIQNVFLNV